MYKRHKRQLSICVMATTAMAFMFDWDFTPIAEIAVTVASIAMGVYIAAVSALLGSQYAKDLKGTTDRELPSKTLLGVLADYFRYAGFSCILLILTSCLFLIPSNIIFPPRIISFKVNKSGISRLWDARDTIAVGQQGQVLFPPVEPRGCFRKKSVSLSRKLAANSLAVCRR